MKQQELKSSLDEGMFYKSSYNFNETFTTKDIYSEKLENLQEFESITTNYFNNLKSKISRALLISFELTNEQWISFLKFMYHFISIEQQSDTEFNEIEIAPTVENEILFSRKSIDGISIISIDEDGDILFNFTGFKSGFTTLRYTFEEAFDWETLIYNFLAK